MKKFIAAALCAAKLFSLSAFTANAASIQAQILSLMNNNPVASGSGSGGLSVSEDPIASAADAENIRNLYSVSKKIVSLSLELTNSESAEIEKKVNAYIDSVDEASSRVADKSGETYAEMLEQKSSLEAEIAAQPPRISSVESIYPDEEFSVSVHFMYKSQKQREYTLILRNTTTGKTIDSKDGVIPSGGTNGTTVFTAKYCSAGDTVSVTVKYNEAERRDVPDCVFRGTVLADSKSIASAVPSYEPTAAPSHEPTAAPVIDAGGASDWAKEEIEGAIRLEIVPSALQKNYTDNITRAGFCALAGALIEGCTQMDIDDFAAQSSSFQPVFTDTSDSTIKACARLGIVTGYDDGSFRPDDDITREQAAAMLARCARTLGMTDKPGMFAFNDRDSVSPWAVNNVRFVKANGIMNGDENDNFLPHNTYTTEQAIVTFYRLADKLGEN